MSALTSLWQKELQRIDERRMLYIANSRSQAEAFAIGYFVAAAKSAIAQRGAFYVAISGGSTPNAIYSKLAEATYSKSVDWSKVHLFWSDERCVPATHPDSNYHTSMLAGLEKLPIPPQQVHRMHGDEEPAAACAAYETEINATVPGAIFDLIMLGMGDDGHVASLFPGTKALEVTDRLVAANEVKAKDSWRLTLTIPCIQLCRQAMIYVIGNAKAAMLKRVMGKAEGAAQLPAQLVGSKEHPALWVTDAEAAQLLSQV